MSKAQAAMAADIVIAGGGLAGLALACALGGRSGGAGFKIIVVDTVAANQRRDQGFDGRALALSPSSRMMLTALGVWDGVSAVAEPIRKMQITDSKPGQRVRPRLLDFDSTGRAEPLAHMVEVRHLFPALLDEIAKSDNITVLAPESVVTLDMDGDGVRAGLQSGGEITARLIAACDGRDSPLRAMAGIKVVSWDYPQSGVVTTVEHTRPHNGVAYEHFLPPGPFAILPLSGNRSSLVWTEYSDVAARLIAGDEEEFADQLRQRFGRELGKVRPVGPRWAYPLSFHLARAYVAGRLALVGDAAHVTHPISGLGFNLGLRDAAALGEAVIDSARLGLDPGVASGLARYERWRRFDNAATALGNDMLNRLFSNDNEALRVTRDFGLRLADRIAPLKRFFMSEAAGHSGEVPRLLRGEPL